MNDPRNLHHEVRTDGGRWTPKACPHCGHDGAFDGMGPFNRKTASRTLDGDGKVETWERWSRLHCPECDNQFAMLDKTVRTRYDETGKEHKDHRELVTDGGQVAHCECNVPALTVNRGHVGDWYVQIVYCGECMTRLRTFVHHQAVIDGVAEGQADVLPEFEEMMGAEI